MDSLSFNNNSQNVNNNKKQKVSFTGQKSSIDVQGHKNYKFYAPPFDKSKYSVALELVPLKHDEKSGALVPAGNSYVLANTMLTLSNNMPVELKDGKNIPNTDMVGYRFVLIDNNAYKTSQSIEASRKGYLLDSAATAEGKDGKFSYFSKKQGFVNKQGPMYHIFPDSYNVNLKDKDDFVRNGFNKAGGNIQGIIEKLKQPNSELDPYEMIISTPLFGGDVISSHGYWTANPYQISSLRGNLEDFKDLQIEMFDAGKTYVADGAFTSQSFEGPQFQHVLRHGKASPFYHWFKLDRPDSPNLNIKLGILPDPIVAGFEKGTPEYKRAEMLKENIAFKIVNPDIKADGYTYDPTKPTYLQFYDKRFAGKQGDDIKNLIMSYDKHTLDNHYDVTEHQDSVQPFFFQVNPQDPRFKTKGASLKDLEKLGYGGKNNRKGYDAFFEMDNYTITTKGQSGGATTWDGNVDLIKMNISTPRRDSADVVGNKQVKNNFYNLATYWTKTTDSAIMEHLAKSFAQDPSATLQNLAGKHGIDEEEIIDLYEEVKEEGNETFRKQIENKKLPDALNEVIINFPFETVEFAFDLTGTLSTDFITPRPTSRNDDETKPKSSFLKNTLPAAQTLYKDDMNAYAMSVLTALDEHMPDDKKLLDKSASVKRLTPYGRLVLDLAGNDIMKFGVVKSLFPETEVKYDKKHSPIYSKDLANKGLRALGIISTTPEDDAKAVISKMKRGLGKLESKPDAEFINSLVLRFKNINLEDYEMARAFMDKTGAGLNWRFDAAKDVADLDQRRAQNPEVTFEDCWDEVIDFWGNFIKNVRDVNPASYVVAEVTNLWEFSRGQGSNKNAIAAKDLEKFNKLDETTQKYVALKFYKDLSGKIGTGTISDDTKNALENLAPEEVYANPSSMTDEQFAELKNYYIDQNTSEEGAFKMDFGKYIDPNIAERMLYDKTGATTGSNYATFFGLYPNLFGQDFEHGKSDRDWTLHTMKALRYGPIGDYFKSGTPQFLNQSHIFVGNHDKPRPLHCFAVDMELFLGNLQSEEHKLRAKAVTKSTDYDNISSMAVAVGESELKMFKSAAKKLGLNQNEVKTLERAIADLAVGKYQNHTNPDMQRSRAYGFTPFDITMKDVILQARYLAENEGMTWSLSDGKEPNDKELTNREQKLFNATFRELTPALYKLSSMWEMMCCSFGIPTLFAGDELAQSGYETPTKNVELAIRNVIHHEWLKDADKDFVADFNDKMMAVSKLHKKNKKLSALSNGSPLMVPQDNEDNHFALFKYNDKGSNVLVVYSNKRMLNGGESYTDKATANFIMDSEGVDTIDGINLGYIDMQREDQGVVGNVAKDGAVFKKLVYVVDKDGKGQYMEDSNDYVVKDGKLYCKKKVGPGGSKVESLGPVKLEGITNIFYRVK